MRPSRRDIVIATRRSCLATTQSKRVGRYLHQLNPNVSMRLVKLESEGDRVTDHPLATLGGKGLFTRSIEQALQNNRADIAVHSLKDMPTDQTPGLVLTAITRRLAMHDVLIARDAERIEDLPEGATVGTCSRRRAAQLLWVRPDLRIVPLRGNVETRIAKVIDSGEMDATLLAAAGLMRLEMNDYLQKVIPVEQILPAAGQGALAIQCRGDDHITIRRCMTLNDAATSTSVNAERKIASDLGADCHSPIAVLAEPQDTNQIRIRARVLSVDGQTCLKSDCAGPIRTTEKLCQQIVDDLTSQGASQLLSEASAD